jgi:CheY-like chemotaxis protein
MLYRRDDLFEVYVECPENLLVSVDRLRLKQVVLNLARNSAKFVEHGFVRLVARRRETGIYIFVMDSGPGIPEEKRGSLYARFQESLDELNQGTGIGLSLCKKLIDLMGGNIWLENNYHSGLVGKPGTKFVIELDCDSIKMDIGSLAETERGSDGWESGESSRSSSEPSPLFTPPSSKQEDERAINVLPVKMSVLFVDDDMVLRKLFARSLKRVQPDWTVQEAANGETALLMAEKETYDIIFIDQYMTSVEKQLLGTETCRMFRSKRIKSLICGLSANDMETPFKTAGADAFLMKPFPCKPEPLEKELLRILNEKDSGQ